MTRYEYRTAARPAPARRRARPAGSRNMLFLLGLVLVCSLFFHINRMSAIAAGAKEISALKREIATLTSDKQYREISLAARQNLERVQYEALNRLGMVYPGEGQVQVIYLDAFLGDSGLRTAYDTTAKDGE